MTALDIFDSFSNGYGSSYYDDYGSSYSTFAFLGTAAVVCAILAITGGIVLYFTFLSKKNEGKFTKFTAWLYNFLNFKELLAEKLLKITYLILACNVTLYSLCLLFFGTGNFGENFISFIFTLVLGNVAIRILYELILLVVLICRNTSEINKKLGKLPEEQKHQNTPLNSQYSNQNVKQQAYSSTPAQNNAPVQNNASVQNNAPSQNIHSQNTTSAPKTPEQNISFCSKCGTQIEPQSNACPSCGNPKQ